jgi:hypothetical protein
MKALILVFFSCFITILINAQPFTLNKNIKPVELKLIPYKQKDSAYNGKINITTVTQKEDTLYFFVKGLSMYQPTYIGFDSDDKKQKTKIYLCKDNWKAPNKTGQLADGYWYQKFKTEGSYGIMVIKNKPIEKYNIMVWVGKEMLNRKLPSPFKTLTKAAAKEPAKTKTKSKAKS